jgi:carboxypeptidase C (cathepsin A)
MFFIVVLFVVCLGFDSDEKPFTFPNYNGPALHASSGFINSLFYVKFENPDLQNAKNLLVWIQGGPGCSGLAGMMLENGPVFTTDGKNLEFRSVNWLNLNASLLYIEQPIGTGFSALGNNTPVLRYKRVFF